MDKESNMTEETAGTTRAREWVTLAVRPVFVIVFWLMSKQILKHKASTKQFNTMLDAIAKLNELGWYESGVMIAMCHDDPSMGIS